MSNNNRYNNIIKSLSSEKNEDVLTAIRQLRKYGKPESIPYLLKLYYSTTDIGIKEHINSFLYDLKDQAAAQPIIEEIINTENLEKKAFLISIFWQSSLDASEYLNELVNEAISSDFKVCFEVLTVIDTIDATYNEDEIIDLIYDLDEAIENEFNEKKDLLITIKTSINSLNIEF